jgi:hypothetical protein
LIDTINYPIEPAAAKYGASVAIATDSPRGVRRRTVDRGRSIALAAEAEFVTGAAVSLTAPTPVHQELAAARFSRPELRQIGKSIVVVLAWITIGFFALAAVVRGGDDSLLITFAAILGLAGLTRLSSYARRTRRIHASATQHCAWLSPYTFSAGRKS